MPFPSECWRQNQTTPPGHVYIVGWGGGTLFAAQSCRFTHHPCVSALELAFPEYREGKGKYWGCVGSLFSRTFQRRSGTAQNYTAANCAKLRYTALHLPQKAIAARQWSATSTRYKGHLRGPRAAYAFTPTRAQSPRRSRARLVRSAGLGSDSDFSGSRLKQRPP